MFEVRVGGDITMVLSEKPSSPLPVTLLHLTSVTRWYRNIPSSFVDIIKVLENFMLSAEDMCRLSPARTTTL